MSCPTPDPTPEENPAPDGRPVVMRRTDGAALIATIAGLALWFGLTDGMLRYLRPSMRPWLVLSGIALALLAVTIATTQWRDGRRRRANPVGESEHPTPPGHRLGLVGWLIGLPLVIAVGINPGALGAYAIGRQQPFTAGSIDFDLDQYLRTHSFGGQTPELKLQEFLASARGDQDDQDLLAETEVRLTGFVVTGQAEGSGFHLARLVIGCCAGDALTITVEVQGHQGVPPADDTWVEVTGTFDPEASGDESRDSFLGAPVIEASSVDAISSPPEPYEYPR